MWVILCKLRPLVCLALTLLQDGIWGSLPSLHCLLHYLAIWPVQCLWPVPWRWQLLHTWTPLWQEWGWLRQPQWLRSRPEVWGGQLQWPRLWLHRRLLLLSIKIVFNFDALLAGKVELLKCCIFRNKMIKASCAGNFTNLWYASVPSESLLPPCLIWGHWGVLAGPKQACGPRLLLPLSGAKTNARVNAHFPSIPHM